MSAHRFWRVRVLQSWNGLAPCWISEVEFRNVVGGPDLTLIGNGGTAISSGVFNGDVASYGPNNAFGNSGTYFGSSEAPPLGWVGWDFGVGVSHDIIQVVITNVPGPTADYNPKELLLEKSDDGTNWSVYSMMPDMPYGTTATKTFNYLAPPTGTIYLIPASPSMLMYGGGSAYLSPPVHVVGYGGASASLTAPTARLAFFLGSSVGLTAPPPTLLATGRSSAGDNDFTYTAPVPTLSARGGANAKLTAPSPTLTTTATFTNFGRASITAPSATLSASGTVSGTGQANLTFNDPYKLVGYSGAVCSITLTGGYTVQAQSTAGSIGGAAITCPLFKLSASGTAQNYGSANLLAPAARLGAQAQAWLAAPSATLTAIGSAVVTASYEAYAVNLLHRNTDAPVDETTRYTNFPFTHVVRYQNSYYGANSTGLYLLEGTTDDGTPIPWEFKTAITDFESPMVKTVASAYFAGRMGPEATVSVYLGESGDVSYSHSTPRGAAAQNYRQVFGKGLKDRYYALSVAGEGVMELDALELNTKTLTRRI